MKYTTVTTTTIAFNKYGNGVEKLKSCRSSISINIVAVLKKKQKNCLCNSLCTDQWEVVYVSVKETKLLTEFSHKSVHVSVLKVDFSSSQRPSQMFQSRVNVKPKSQ